MDNPDFEQCCKLMHLNPADVANIEITLHRVAVVMADGTGLITDDVYLAQQLWEAIYPDMPMDADSYVAMGR